MSLYISGINYESINDGEGVRAVIYISGCRHNCPDCHNPDTHNFKNGKKVNEKLIRQINTEIKKRTFLSGITLSGGDPMYSAKEVRKFLDKIYIPNNNIWIYSGFTIEEILKNKEMSSLLRKCNVIVDGLFKKELRDITLLYKGSTNQRIINIKDYLLKGEINEY